MPRGASNDCGEGASTNLESFVGPALLPRGVLAKLTNEPDATCDFTYQGAGSDPYGGCLDRFDRVIQIPWIKSSSPIAGATYEYDRSSNRMQMQPLGFTATSALQRYSYDGVNRLTRLIRGAADEMQVQEQWSLDATGNWRQYDVLDVDDASKNLAQSRQANRVNEITDVSRRYGEDWPTPTYDRAGNTTSFPQPLAPTEGFSAIYDAWNRLIALTEDGEETPAATYAYDCLTRRITTNDGTNVRHCYYSASWRNIEERLNSDATANCQFTWGLRYIDDQVCRDTDSTRLYGLQDANWDLVAVTEDDGDVQQRYRYSAYGQPIRLNADGTAASGSDTIQWNYLYYGYRYEHEVGLNLVRYRWLDNLLGRWLTRDIIGYSGTANLLLFYSSNPNRFIDPYGLQQIPTKTPFGPFGTTTSTPLYMPGTNAPTSSVPVDPWGSWMTSQGNCTRFAINSPKGPGTPHNIDLTPDRGFGPKVTCEDVLQGARDNGAVSVGADGKCPECHTQIFAVVADPVVDPTGKLPPPLPRGDYHWYRQSGNSWSHKPGESPSSCFDASGAPIADPNTADYDYTNTDTDLARPGRQTAPNYQHTCGALCWPDDKKIR